ncbi:MAG: hypothetical protein M1830_008664 [Pleopsidium flavum]|nr:MAG: hypothetical protein M1830_008664 [Pleopsidium flavum]
MCIRHQIAYHCNHTFPLDPGPTLCSKAKSVISDAYNVPCKDIEQQAIPSDDRQKKRQKGEAADEEDVELEGSRMELFGWWVRRGRNWRDVQMLKKVVLEMED